MDGKRNKEQVKQMVQAVGAMAEMGLIFYRAAIDAGADNAEAIRLTQAYLSALLFGNQQNQKPPEIEGE